MKCLVIMVNGLQAAYLGCYGNDWLPTPNLDRLASEGVVFDQHFVADACREDAHHSWCRDSGDCGGSVHLLELFWKQGVSAVLIGDEDASLFRNEGGVALWEQVQRVRRRRLAEIEQETLLGGVVQTACEWLAANGKRDDWLLWLETNALMPPWDAAGFDAEALEGLEEEKLEPWFDPFQGQGPLTVTKEQARRLTATYGGMVAGLDQWLGQLLDTLRAENLLEDILVLVTSDGGLALGERGTFGDLPTLYEESVHIPLVIRMPHQKHGGRRVQQLTQGTDLFPSLVEWFGIRGASETAGKSLLTACRGEAAGQRRYLYLQGPGPSRGIRTHGWYLILPRQRPGLEAKPPELYVKPEDRWEVNNVAGQFVDVAEHLELAVRCLSWGEDPRLREEVLKTDH